MKTAGNQDAGNVVSADVPDAPGAFLGLKRFKIADFAVPEHQHAARPEIFVEPREREARFLHVRAGDAAIEPVAAAEKIQIQPHRVRPAL